MSASPSPSSIVSSEEGTVDATKRAHASSPAASLLSYTSNEVALPSRVDELVRQYIERDHQCRELRDCLERFGSELTRIADSNFGDSACALQLRDVLRHLARALQCTAAQARKSGTSRPSQVTPAARAAAVQPSLAHHGVVSGTVVKAALVRSRPDTAAAAAATRRPTATTSPNATTAPTAVVSGVVLEASETDTVAQLLGELRRGDVVAYERLCIRVLALEAAERLLRECRTELEACARTAARMALERQYAMDELQLLREALNGVTATEAAEPCVSGSALSNVADVAKTTGQVSAGGALRQLAEYATRAASLQVALAKAERTCEEQCYHAAQLERELTAVQKDRTFQLEKVTQLEGQVHRLLSATAAANSLAGNLAAQPRVVPPSATAAAAAVPGADELRATIARLNAEAKRRAHRCTKLENAVTSLSTENAELKGKVLQFQRQLNERELAAEREATAREDAERARELEHECAVLRNELHECGERGAAERAALQDSVTQLRRRETVYEHAVQPLLRRLFALQLSYLAHSMTCVHKSAGDAEAEHQGSSATAAAALRERCGPAETPLSCAARDPRLHSVTLPDASPTGEAGRGAVGWVASHSTAAADSALSTAEQHRSELLQMQRVNKELRQALARTREELLQKESLLQRLTTTHGVGLEMSSGGGNGGGGASDLSRPGLSWTTDFATTTAKAVETGGNGRAELSAPQSAVVAAGPAARTPPTPQSPPQRLLPPATTTTTTPQGSVSVASLLPDEDGVPPSPPHTTGVDDVDDSVCASAVRLQRTHSMTKDGGRVARSEAELHYDPAHMPEWQLVQVENEVLVRRLAAVQEEKWDLDTRVEELERRCGALQAEVERNAATMNRLVVAGVFSPAAVTRGGAEGRLRGVQRLLQETLEQKIALQAEVTRLRQMQQDQVARVVARDQ